jgi:hypothetical protein
MAVTMAVAPPYLSREGGNLGLGQRTWDGGASPRGGDAQPCNG